MDSNKKHEEIIDTFERKLIRRILDINWQDKISNEKLCKEPNLTPWTQTVELRRLTWYANLLSGGLARDAGMQSHPGPTHLLLSRVLHSL